MEQVVSPELSQAVADSSASSSSSPGISPVASSAIDSTFSSQIDLIGAPLRPRIIALSDEFFAPAAALLRPQAPIRRAQTFVSTGAWYDGWETRRHNRAGFDYVIIHLGPAAGRVVGIEIDTTFFTGNYAPAVSVEGTYELDDADDATELVDDGPTPWDQPTTAPIDEHPSSLQPPQRSSDIRVAGSTYDRWQPLLPESPVGSSKRQAWSIPVSEPITHVRLRSYPDGGIARFRLYGQAVPAWRPTASSIATSSSSEARKAESTATLDELSSILNGGRALARSDEHYGCAANLIMPGRGRDMGDGWETARSRSAGHTDWAVIRLGARGTIEQVLLDTLHFRGNFPRLARVEACDVGAEAFARETAAALGATGHSSSMGSTADLQIKIATASQTDALLLEATPLQPPSQSVIDSVSDHSPQSQNATWANAEWTTVVPDRPTAADQEILIQGPHLAGHAGPNCSVFSHVRLVIIPDGGVKRLRVFGRRV